MIKDCQWKFEMREEEGWIQLAPLSYWHTHPDIIDEVTGGCGPGGFGDWLVPDTILGESVFLPCRIHDWMYHEGETKVEKDIADAVFLFNMTMVINDHEFLDGARMEMVLNYYKAVSLFGDGAFEGD